MGCGRCGGGGWRQRLLVSCSKQREAYDKKEGATNMSSAWLALLTHKNIHIYCVRVTLKVWRAKTGPVLEMLITWKTEKTEKKNIQGKVRLQNEREREGETSCNSPNNNLMRIRYVLYSWILYLNVMKGFSRKRKPFKHVKKNLLKYIWDIAECCEIKLSNSWQ